jgi:uncharacterized membrane protein
MRIFTFHKKKIVEIVFLLIVILSVIPIIIPFFHKGFFPTHDDVQMQRIFEMSQALKYGSFPPRWASGLLFGHGYPLFSFYSPLTYYLGSLLVFVGANFLVATKIVFIMTFFLGAISMYLLVKEIFGRLPGLVASILFSYAPYKAVDVYVRGNLPEFLSLSLLPLVLWLNWLFLKSKNLIWLPLFSLSLALLTLTHNISFVIFAFFLAVFNLVIIMGLKEKKQMFLKTLGGGFLALMISSFFWVPLLIETKLVNLVNQPWPHSYDKYFLTFKQLWSSTWGFNGFLEPQPMSLQIGKTFIVFSVIAVLVGLFRKYNLHKKLWLLFSVFFFFSVFMTTFSSSFVWKALPFLSFFQFPWRFHILITFSGSIVIASLFFFLEKIILRKKWPKVLIWLTILVVAGAMVFENYRFFKPKLYWEPIAVSESTTWDDEYLPLWVKVKPKDYEGEKVKIIQGEGEVANLSWGYYQKSFTFLANQESEIEIAHIYYPGWKVFVNGEQKEIDYSNERGLMRINLLGGQNLVEFKFLRTPLRLISEIISLFFLLVVGFLLLKVVFRRENKGKLRRRSDISAKS